MTYVRRLSFAFGLSLAPVAAGCGGPMNTNNSADLSMTGGCAQNETLTDVKASVFAMSCNFSSCHNAASHIGGLDLVTDPYHALVNAATVYMSAKADFPMRVVAGDTSKSFLVKKLTLPGTMDPKYGQRMPNTGQMIDPGQLAKVECWIMNGAKND